jgi:hypothetical protein
MHTQNATLSGVAGKCGEPKPGETFKRNMRYIPTTYPDVDSQPPNSISGSNPDQLHECPPLEQRAARFENMPCSTDAGTWTSAAPRSNHPGGVNATHCDGSSIFINNDIDQFLMARIVSINDGQGEIEGFSK